MPTLVIKATALEFLEDIEVDDVWYHYEENDFYPYQLWKLV